jgi:hypothetical protein
MSFSCRFSFLIFVGYKNYNNENFVEICYTSSWFYQTAKKFILPQLTCSRTGTFHCFGSSIVVLPAYTLFDENIKNHAVSLALLLIYIDFDRKVFKKV